jgi:hypothetical protein
MCGQVDRRLTPDVPDNSLHGLQRYRLAGTDTIDLLFKEGLLRVRRIARQEVIAIVIEDNHRNVPWRVSWGRHDDDRAIRGNMVTSIKGSEGLRLEVDRPGSEPLRPSVWQVTPKPPSEPFRKRSASSAATRITASTPAGPAGSKSADVAQGGVLPLTTSSMPSAPALDRPSTPVARDAAPRRPRKKSDDRYSVSVSLCPTDARG